MRCGMKVCDFEINIYLNDINQESPALQNGELALKKRQGIKIKEIENNINDKS